METNYGSMFWFINEGIIFITFLTICAMLTPRRFTIRTTLLTAGGFLLGVTGLNAALLLTGHPAMQVLSLLPLTAYMPMIICMHILSRVSFFQTTAVWHIGLMAFFILRFAVKFIRNFLTMQIDGSFPYLKNILTFVGVIFLSAILLYILGRHIQKPLKRYILELRINWIVMWLPLLLVIALFSYFSWSTLNPTVSTLLLLTALTILLVISMMLKSAYETMCLRQNENNLAAQIEMQKHDYEVIYKKIENGRVYRHDMRHHFAALDTLLQQGNNDEALAYIQKLNDKFGQIEQNVYCKNLTVNAILSFYFGQAKATGCHTDVNIEIPKELPFDDMDLCVIFSNALENAIHACEKIVDVNERKIRVSASCMNGKMAICVENTCLDFLKFDNAGFPIVQKKKEHGIGLKSIDAVVKKYNGFFCCSLDKNVFSMKSVIFEHINKPPVSKKSHKNAVKQTIAITCYLILAFCLFVNAAPAVAAALKDIPIVGNIVRVITLESFRFQWGSSELNVNLPKVEVETPLRTDKQTEGPKPTNTLTEGTASEESKPSTKEIHTNALIEDTPAEEIEPSAKEIHTYEESQASNRETFVTTGENGTPRISLVPQIPASEPTLPDGNTGELPSDFDEEGNPPANKKPPDLSDGVEEINRQMEEYVEQLRNQYIQYLSMKYQGYVGMDTTYTVICNNNSMLSIRFITTVNLGGSVEVSRIFTLDKRTGKVIELKDLFLENTDYTQPISDEILRQMKQQVKSGNGNYFIPGGIWSDSECFKAIQADQNFYINDRGKLTIVFDEYIVAPGYMGCPEFIIPTELLETLLIKPSLLK